MYSHSERNGPMGTYLVTAAARSNFHIWLNTSLERVVRTTGHATGLDVVANHGGGYTGRVNLTPITGRVIVSAGTFGTAKLLFRSKVCALGTRNLLTFFGFEVELVQQTSSKSSSQVLMLR
jgi:cellobiose dehydrogenase (acceptor)